MTKPKVIFISESIRRDSHLPLRFVRSLEVKHFYLSAPYGDMGRDDFKGAEKVALGDLPRRIAEEKPAVIQGVEPFGSRLALKLSFISLRAKRATGAKLIVPVLENRPVSERFNLFQRVVLRLFCPIYFRQADRVICLNRGAVRNVRRYFERAKITVGVVWGVWGVDGELFRPVAPKEKGLVLYVGRLVEEKGLRYLMEGFKAAAADIPRLKLKIAGGGPMERDLRRFVEQSGLGDKVEFLGFIKNKNLPSIYSSAELVVYPSVATKKWEEQVGTVNFQALACATPILTTKSGAIPEYIKNGEGAILVKEKSAKQIAAAIRKFFSDSKERIRLTKLARPFVSRYEARGEIAKAEKIIREAIRER